jgi:hypothetical protein
LAEDTFQFSHFFIHHFVESGSIFPHFSKVWASLLHSLDLISGTMQGRSQLHLQKHRGFGERLREELTEGWGEMTETMEAHPFEPRARQLFAS